MTTTEIDLTKFCADYDGKFFRTTPFVYDGFKYAGDGRILVRVPTDEPAAAIEHFEFEKVAEVFTPTVGGPAPWSGPMVIIEEFTDCWNCDDGRVDRKKCPACEGTGQYTCPQCHNESDCTDCFGEGYITAGKCCPECGGSGRTKEYGHRVGRHIIRPDFYRLIGSLPNPFYFLGDSAKPLPFIFDGGEGRVMGMREP